MKVKVWGCRGSIAISSPDCAKYGGNTTCFEIQSDCIPKSSKLMIDAGTGFVPAGYNYLPQIKDGLNYQLFFTHYHWDHIMGLTLAPPTFVDEIPINLYGPQDENVEVEDMLAYLLQRPYFPVDSKRITHRMNFRSFLDLDVHVILVHPEGGFDVMEIDKYRRQLEDDKGLLINSRYFRKEECLIIKMAKANHANTTCISYRFEENPSGKVFVLLTDHEDTAGISKDLKDHLKGADLAVIDAQYDARKYQTTTANFGHGTPEGVIRLALASAVKKVGITHHDPMATDEYLEKTIFKEAVKALEKYSKDSDFLGIHNLENTNLKKSDLFLCKDYDLYEI